ISNFLLIWMIDKLLLIYRRPEIKSVMFDLGLLVATGTLFYFPFITLFLLLWINLILLRPFNWREWTAGIVGFLTIYFILFIMYFWLDKLPLFKNIWLPLTHPFPTSLHIDIYDYLVLIVPVIILILFIISVQQNIFKSVIH